MDYHTIKDKLEFYGRLSLTIIAALYAMGFVVWSFYLAQYGIHSNTLLRPQYLIAGVWLLLWLLAVLAPLVFFSSLNPSRPNSTRAPQFQNLIRAYVLSFVLVAVSMIATLILIVIIGALLTGLPSMDDSDTATLQRIMKWSVWSGASLLLVTWIELTLVRRYKTMHHSTLRKTTVRSAIMLVGLLLLALSLWHVWLFSVSVFPSIPQSVGGGKPITIRLLNSGADLDPPKPEPAPDRTYRLLLEDDDSYVLYSSENKMTFKLPRTEFHGYSVAPVMGSHSSASSPPPTTTTN
jgi:hypothetical protein